MSAALDPTPVSRAAAEWGHAQAVRKIAELLNDAAIAERCPSLDRYRTLMLERLLHLRFEVPER